jgi:hypothetical protein
MKRSSTVEMSSVVPRQFEATASVNSMVFSAERPVEEAPSEM